MPGKMRFWVLPTGAVLAFALWACGGEPENCSVSDNGDGTYDIVCPDSRVTVRDGRDGRVVDHEGVAGEDGADGANALAELVKEPAGENCRFGGTKVLAGVDADGDGALAEGEVTHRSYVCNGHGPLTVVFSGFEEVRAGMRSFVSLEATLPTTFDPEAPLQWALVVREATTGDPVPGIRAYYRVEEDLPSLQHREWANAIETDANGVALYPEAAFTAPEAGLYDGSLLEFSLLVAEDGPYEVALELRLADSGMVVATQSTVFEPLERIVALSLDGFTGFLPDRVTAITMGGKAAGDLEPELPVRWRATFEAADGTPVSGLDIIAPGTAVDPMAYTYTTNADGRFLWPEANFPVSDIQGFPRSTPFRLRLPAGEYTATLELLDMTQQGAPTVLGGETVTIDTDIAWNAVGFDRVAPAQRGTCRVDAQLADSFEGTRTVQWVMTFNDPAGNPVRGVRAYFPLAGEEDELPSAWTGLIETGTDGRMVHPAAGFLASELQGVPAALEFDLWIELEGLYSARFDLVDPDLDEVLAGFTQAVTVEAAGVGT